MPWIILNIFLRSQLHLLEECHEDRRRPDSGDLGGLQEDHDHGHKLVIIRINELDIIIGSGLLKIIDINLFIIRESKLFILIIDNQLIVMENNQFIILEKSFSKYLKQTILNQIPLIILG